LSVLLLFQLSGDLEFKPQSPVVRIADRLLYLEGFNILQMRCEEVINVGVDDLISHTFLLKGESVFILIVDNEESVELHFLISQVLIPVREDKNLRIVVDFYKSLDHVSVVCYYLFSEMSKFYFAWDIEAQYENRLSLFNLDAHTHQAVVPVFNKDWTHTESSVVNHHHTVPVFAPHFFRSFHYRVLVVMQKW